MMAKIPDLVKVHYNKLLEGKENYDSNFRSDLITLNKHYLFLHWFLLMGKAEITKCKFIIYEYAKCNTFLLLIQ